MCKSNKIRTYVKITLKRHSRFCLLFASVRTTGLLKSITVVPIGAMLRPRTHTDPAKLVFALAAGHMVAPTILFDRRLTFAALFGVGRDPIGRLRVVGTFFLPRSD